MTALIPELAVVTTSVGAVMIRLRLGLGLRRGLLQPRKASRGCPSRGRLIDGPVCRPLHRKHGLIFGIPAWARLAVVFHQSSVSLDGTRKEACVRSERDSSAVAHVVDTVEGWLEKSGASSAKRGERSFTVVRPVPIASVS
jgi:hypothetical protein